MTNTERIIEEIKKLPELEFVEVMKEAQSHVIKERIRCVIIELDIPIHSVNQPK